MLDNVCLKWRTFGAEGNSRRADGTVFGRDSCCSSVRGNLSCPMDADGAIDMKAATTVNTRRRRVSTSDAGAERRSYDQLRSAAILLEQHRSEDGEQLLLLELPDALPLDPLSSLGWLLIPARARCQRRAIRPVAHEAIVESLAIQLRHRRFRAAHTIVAGGHGEAPARREEASVGRGDTGTLAHRKSLQTKQRR